MSDKKVSLNQISVNEIPLNNLVDEMSAGHMSSYGLDSKSAAYLTKKNTLANHINPTNYLNIVFIILFLVILTYGIYKFKKE